MQAALVDDLADGEAGEAMASEAACYAQISSDGNVTDERDDAKAKFSIMRSGASLRVVLLVLICISVWWMTALGITMAIKRTVSAGAAFPYAFAFTAMTQTLTGVFAILANLLVSAVGIFCKGRTTSGGSGQLFGTAGSARSQQRDTAVPHLSDTSETLVTQRNLSLSRWDAALLLGIGAMQGVEIGLTNKSLQYLTVAARTMLNSTAALFMMISARVWGMEPLGSLRLACGALLCLGGVAQSLDQKTAARTHTEEDMLIVGVAMQVTSIIVASQRWVLTQYVLQQPSLDTALGRLTKLELLAYVMPVTGCACLLFSLVFEDHAYAPEHLLQKEVLEQVLLVVGSLVCMLYSELVLVQTLSAVAFLVLGSVHQIPIVIAGVFLQHNHVGPMGAIGFATCVLAGLIYAWARHKEKEYISSEK